MLTKQTGLFVLWVCAMTVVVGIYVIALNWEQSGGQPMHASFALGGVSTGVTVTESIPPSFATISKAVPLIKGPAPLPSEEQGLPGD
ncbi:hypothetical protein ACVWWN_004486 [Mycobacterium sp. URHB0021]|jgi:hypothetical protein